MQEEPVRSVNRATRILQTLGEGASSIKDISNAVDLSNSTVHRLLRALEASNFVIYDPSRRRYYLGPLLLKLATNPMIAHNHLINCALDEMYRLRDISSETVALQIFAGVKRIFLEVVPSLQQIKHTEEKGNSVPLYAGSAGKVMLAELSQPDLRKIVRLMKAVDPVPEILKNEDEFLKELEKIRVQGYAITYSTQTQGGAAISLPIRNYVCPVAISIFGPAVRFQDPLIVLEETRKSATRISNNLLSSAGCNTSL